MNLSSRPHHVSFSVLKILAGELVFTFLGTSSSIHESVATRCFRPVMLVDKPHQLVGPRTAFRRPWCFVDVGGVGWGVVITSMALSFIGHATLLYVLLCFALMRHATLLYVLLCFALMCHATLSYVLLNFALMGHATMCSCVLAFKLTESRS